MQILRLRVKIPNLLKWKFNVASYLLAEQLHVLPAAGWAKAMRYLLTGDSFDAKAAFDMNLITEICPEGTELKRAIELAEHIAQAAPLAVKATLASAREAVNEGYEVAFNQLQNHLQPLLTTEDVQEGVFAMLQKDLLF